MFNEESDLDIPEVNPFAKGCFYAVLFCLVFWGTIGLLLWLIL